MSEHKKKERKYENCEVCGKVVENPQKCGGCGKIMCVDCACEPPAAETGVREAIHVLCDAAESGGLDGAHDLGNILWTFITRIECDNPECDGCLPWQCASMLEALQETVNEALLAHEREMEEGDSDG